MKRKTIVAVLAALCFLLLVFIPFILIGTWKKRKTRFYSSCVHDGSIIVHSVTHMPYLQLTHVSTTDLRS